MSVIDRLVEITDGEVDNRERGYLGMSMIGEPCLRKLQYSMYLVSPVARISRRVERLFNDGHLFEEKLISILNAGGIEIYGRQIELFCENNFWSGHIDGLIDFENETYLVEMKTHNDKNFKSVVKSKVKDAKPAHYDQMQMYMGHGGWKSCIYIAYNKNDSDIHYELVHFNLPHFERLKVKSVDVIATDSLHQRIGNNSPIWYECKFCNVSNICFGKELPDINCRTCENVDVHNSNKWSCKLNNSMLSIEEQKQACYLYELNKRFQV